MAYQFNGTNQTLTIPLAQSTPCTFAVWSRPTSVIGSNRILLHADTSPTVAAWGGLGLFFNTTGKLGAFSIQQTPFLLSESFSTASYTQNNWHHCAGIWPSNSSRTSFLDGVASTAATLTINTSPQVIYAGAFDNSADRFSGQLAEVGIWNTDLTAAEIASLAKGMTCDKVRPQSLVFYAPLVRDLIDQKGGLAITNNNGATVANHTRVYA
jgi:hypothetical protein